MLIIHPFFLLAISIPRLDFPDAVGPIINLTMQEIIYSRDEIHKLVQIISEKARTSFVVFLHGELGAGKTFFAQNLLQELGVKDTITSPTFSIFNEYQANDLDIFHYDLYRLKKPEELMFVDIDENVENGMVVIEWPELAREYGIHPNVEIKLFHVDDPSKRKAIIQFHDES